MDEKNKVGLIYSIVGLVYGGISGIITEILLKDVSMRNYFVYGLAILVIYATTYLISQIGIDVEGMGGKKKVALSGAMSFLVPWAVMWIVFYNFF